MAMKLNATARLLTTAAKTTPFPWAKEMFKVVLKGDPHAMSGDMNSSDGYYTSEQKGRAVIKALKAAGYKMEDLGKRSTFSGEGEAFSFDSKTDKGCGVTVNIDEDPDNEDEKVGILWFFNESVG